MNALLGISPARNELSTLGRRRFQQGSLVLRGKRGQEVWVGRWREDVVLPDTSRKRIHRSVVLGDLFELPTKHAAQREMQKSLQIVNGSHSPRIKRLIGFEQFADQWEALVVSTMRPSTQNSISGHLKNWIVPFFKQRPMVDIWPEDVQQLVNSIPLRPRSVKTILGTLQMAWKTAKLWRYVEGNILEGVRTPRLDTPRSRCYSLAEIKGILEEAEEPYKCMFHVAAETGMRAGELMGLRVEDVNFKERTIRIAQTVWAGKLQSPKTEKSCRTLSISDLLTDHVKEHLANTWRENEYGLLFPNQRGRPLSAASFVTRRLYSILDKLNFPRGGLHGFRHANASLMDSEGVPLKVRQNRLGHADPQTTIKIYTHVLDNRSDRETAGKFGMLFGI